MACDIKMTNWLIILNPSERFDRASYTDGPSRKQLDTSNVTLPTHFKFIAAKMQS